MRASSKVKCFANVAKEFAKLSKSSTLKVGCVIVHKSFGSIAAIGYNGSYAGDIDVKPNTGTIEDSLEPGQSGLIHAEINAIAKFNAANPADYIVYVTHSPCKMCMKVLVNAGFKYIAYDKPYRDMSHIAEICERADVICCDIHGLIALYEAGAIAV